MPAVKTLREDHRILADNARFAGALENALAWTRRHAQTDEGERTYETVLTVATHVKFTQGGYALTAKEIANTLRTPVKGVQQALLRYERLYCNIDAAAAINKGACFHGEHNTKSATGKKRRK